MAALPSARLGHTRLSECAFGPRDRMLSSQQPAAPCFASWPASQASLGVNSVLLLADLAQHNLRFYLDSKDYKGELGPWEWGPPV
jgi:hypothetical protein